MSKSSREFKRKMELKRTMSMLKKQIEILERQKKEYLDRAKNARLKGNMQLYGLARSMLKSIIGQTRRLELMQMNLEFAMSQQDFVEHNRNFVKGMSALGKSLVKTVKMIDVNKTMQILEKSMVKVNESMQGLDGLLDNNSMLFDNVAGTDVPDGELDSLIGSEALSAERSIDAEIDKMLGVAVPRAPVASSPVASSPVAAAPAQAYRPQAQEPYSPYSLGDGDKKDGGEDGSANFKFPGDDGYPEQTQSAREQSVPRKPVESGFEVQGNALRPQRLKDYRGQPKAVAALEAPISKALLTGKPLPHVLLCGSFGHGKTTLANIIANEMGGEFIELPAKVPYRDMLRTLKQLKPGDVVFVDEIHDMSRDVIETLMYPAMEDFKVHFTEGNGARSKNITKEIAPFTFVGATTESGNLPRPFYSKFPIKITLEEYEPEIIASIVMNSFRVHGMSVGSEQAMDIARRSRLTPRAANAYVEGIASAVMVQEAARRGIRAKGALSDPREIEKLHITVSAEDVNTFFEKLGIDRLGLSDEDRKILTALVKKYGGGPVGQDNLAKAINVSTNVVVKEYEPFLIKNGYINVRPQGRFATDKTYEYLGIPKDTGLDPTAAPEEKENSAPNFEQPAREPREQPAAVNEDELPVVECTIGKFDQAAAERFEGLLAGESKAFEEPLDQLFPDVDKAYDSSATNQYILRVNGGRELYCDSKLERRFLSYLFRCGFVQDAKSEALELSYDSAQMSDKRYFPDFVVKLYDGRIAVLELKNLAAVGYHLNVDKYEALAKFCRENGYLYAEIAKDYEENRYVCAERIKADYPNEPLRAFIRQKIEENGKCTADDLDDYRYNLRDLLNILLNDRTLKNCDRTGNEPLIVAAE